MLQKYFTLQILACITSYSLVECIRDTTSIQGVDFITGFISNPALSSYKENYIRLPVSTGVGTIQSFTYCFRIKLHSLILHCVFHDSKISFKLQTESYGFILLHNAWILFNFKEALEPLKWYHICMSYDSGHITLIMNNDILLDEESSDLKQLNEPSFAMKSDFTLGLCLKSSYAKDPLKSITRSTIADFNMWSTSFSKESMLAFTTNCVRFSEGADVISWKNFETATLGENAKNIQLQIQDICGTKGELSEEKSLIIRPVGEPYESAKQVCTKLGGIFPQVENREDIKKLNESISLERGYAKTEINVTSVCGNQFWMPIRQNGKNNKTGNYIWNKDFSIEKEIATFLPWEFSQPNGLEHQQCVALDFSIFEYGDYACDVNFCSLCEFRGTISFHLHGLPETSLIDRDYIFVPKLQDVNGLVFRGYKQYQIGWKYSRGQWQISDRSNLNQPVAYFNTSQSRFAIGKQDWSLYPNKGTSSSVSMPLKLSKVNLVHHLYL